VNVLGALNGFHNKFNLIQLKPLRKVLQDTAAVVKN